MGGESDIPNAVEVHQVVRILEVEPLVCGEDVAKVGAIPDDIVIATQLLHAVDVGLREVEPGRGFVEACDERRCVLLNP